MTISIVIPNYNGSALLQKNIPRLVQVLDEHIKKTKNTLELIIVDDYSSDDSVSTIENEFTKHEHSSVKLRLLKSEKNRGFSSTVNMGGKHSTGEILILLNSDAYPEDDFISPFLEHFSDEKLFAVGFMDKSVEHGEVVLRGRGVGRWERGFLVHKRGEIDFPSTLWVNGGSGAFRKKIWDKLGGMDELYSPFYWEDIDLSYRALKSGYSLLFEKKSVVVHEHEKGAIAKTYTKSHVKAIVYRNQIMFTWLNATDSMLLFTHLLWMPVHIVQAVLRGDLSFLQGLFNAFLLLPKIIQSRNRRKKLSVRSDESVVKV